MTIVFFGSDHFAALNLEALVAAGHRVLACVTPPDRAQGRGLLVVPSPVKSCAQKHGITVFQPEDIQNAVFISELKQLAAELFVVIAYGKILPECLLSLPFYCALNVHASLLPKYRGAAPINWAIMNGDRSTGVTVMRMNARMDAGDIVAQEATAISPDEDSQELRARLAIISAQVLVKTLSIPPREWIYNRQNEGSVSRAPKLTKIMGRIDWTQSAVQVHDLVRGLRPWPSAYTFINGQFVKILTTEIRPLEPVSARPGEIIALLKEGLVVATGDGSLLVKTLHPESSHPMSAWSFCRGHNLQKGDSLAD